MEIERLEGQLKPLKVALADLDRLAAIDEARSIPEGPETKYANMRPLLAIVPILKERGKPMKQGELIDILMAGGIGYGKDRGRVNVEMGIRVAVKQDPPKLTRSGKGVKIDDDELIGLPEWKKK